MKKLYFLLWIFILSPFTSFAVDCGVPPTDTWNTTCEYVHNDNENYNLVNRAFLVTDNSTLTVTLSDGYRFGSYNVFSTNSFEVDFGSTVIVNGNLEFGAGTNIRIDGTLIVYGDISSTIDGWLSDVNVTGSVQASGDIDWGGSSNQDGVNPGTVISNDPSLPIELSYFEAFTEGSSIILEWETASEQNASHFEVQRSSDKKSWDTLGEVEASGNSQTSIIYNFIDVNPLEIAYYRLYQVDFDGASEIFGPIQVVKEGLTTPLGLVVMPNNVASGESIQFSITGLVENAALNIQVFNSFGSLVYSEVSQNINSKSLLKKFDFTDQLGTGIYYIVLSSGNNTVKEKLVIK